MASSMSTSDTVIRVLTKDQLLAYLDLPANCSFTQTFDIRGYGVTWLPTDEFHAALPKHDSVPDVANVYKHHDLASGGKIWRATHPTQNTLHVHRTNKYDPSDVTARVDDDASYHSSNLPRCMAELYPRHAGEWRAENITYLVDPNGSLMKSLRTGRCLRLVNGSAIPNMIGSWEGKKSPDSWWICWKTQQGYEINDIVDRIKPLPLARGNRTTYNSDAHVRGRLDMRQHRWRRQFGGLIVDYSRRAGCPDYVCQILWGPGRMKTYGELTDDKIRYNTFLPLRVDPLAGTVEMWHNFQWVPAFDVAEPCDKLLTILRDALVRYPSVVSMSRQLSRDEYPDKSLEGLTCYNKTAGRIREVLKDQTLSSEVCAGRGIRHAKKRKQAAESEDEDVKEEDDDGSHTPLSANLVPPSGDDHGVGSGVDITATRVASDEPVHWAPVPRGPVPDVAKLEDAVDPQLGSEDDQHMVVPVYYSEEDQGVSHGMFQEEEGAFQSAIDRLYSDNSYHLSSGWEAPADGATYDDMIPEEKMECSYADEATLNVPEMHGPVAADSAVALSYEGQYGPPQPAFQYLEYFAGSHMFPNLPQNAPNYEHPQLQQDGGYMTAEQYRVRPDVDASLDDFPWLDNLDL